MTWNKCKHKIFFIFFSSRLHRFTAVALKGIYICILFTAHFFSSYLHFQREAFRNTVLRTNEKSKRVRKFRKKIIKALQCISVQLNTNSIFSFILRCSFYSDVVRLMMPLHSMTVKETKICSTILYSLKHLIYSSWWPSQSDFPKSESER